MQPDFQAHMTLNYSYRHNFEIKAYEFENWFLCQNFYAEQDLSLENAKSETTKDFRFFASYLDKVENEKKRAERTFLY